MVEVILSEEQRQELITQIHKLINDEILRFKDNSNLSNKIWLKKKEACLYLNVSNNTFDKLKYAGLPSATVSGITLYNRLEIDKFYLQHQD